MTSFDELGTFEYTVQQDGGGDGLPRIWWHNGDRKAKTPGVFYTRGEDWVGDLPAPWAPDDRFDNETGWAATALRLLVITSRSQPFRRVEVAGKARREYVVGRWEPGMSIHTEVLCLAEGLTGPVVWSMKGLTGAAMTGKGGIITQARQALIGPAEKALKKKVPLHAFWLPVAARTRDGKIDYVQTEQGAIVTPPALRLPGLEGRDLLNALYAGRDVIEEAGRLQEEYAVWRQERRSADAPPPPDAAQARNTPQAYDPEESFEDVI